MDGGGAASGMDGGAGPGVVHDLGNLIQIATSALNVVGRNPLVGRDASLEPTLARARKALEQAGALVRQTMDRTGDRTREPSLVIRRLCEPQDVPACLAEIAPLIEWICEPDIELSIDLPANLPPVHCSSVDLQNVLLNLVINARDAMPGGGSLSLAVRCWGLQQALEITVADDGIGMSPDTLRWALSPFFTTKPQGRGTGLGLAMAQRFAEEAGGRLDITSAPGAGATVTIRLPC